MTSTTHPTEPDTDTRHWAQRATPWLGGYTLAEIIDTGLAQDTLLIILRSIL